ncbi:hypothetical protein AWH56_011880 [Anaerobacillus isosaccharinicus]|uniref:Uncharacterized protein n=1 Tax=Anaerobacillus isosaccharinicus TaxID=1532552 RepID=A0A1S2M860_9BACI|nr:hypothetical protein [Anaerobacillus isosaccharinicus]MBA5588402.1 hypothetical protein [Anaerobacillus isosaccharinicus]QOY38167.1 hypothetical protein AWH56_011880 [Anaerobacillus isosaccharinicus]
MKYFPYFLSIFGFFLTIILYFLLERYISVDWFVYNYYGNTSDDGTRFEAEIAWLPLLLAVLVSYFGWKLGKRKR